MISAAAIVTWKRPRELKRLLESLAGWDAPPRCIVVADHAPDGSTREIAAAAALSVKVLEDSTNPGPGAGWTRAAQCALGECPEAEALWFLDDDVVVDAGAAARLSEAIKMFGLVAPLLEDAEGGLWGFPEPADKSARRRIRQAQTPQQARALLGPGPHPLCWCTGACVVVTPGLYRRIGPHRPDFFMLGEDLEFSMRAAAARDAGFCCDAVVPHLPPRAAGSSRSEKVKFCSLLQNLSWIAFHSPYRQHMGNYLPGNFRRFVRTFGWSGLPLAIECFWNGAVRGEPAGGVLGQRLRRRLATRESCQ